MYFFIFQLYLWEKSKDSEYLGDICVNTCYIATWYSWIFGKLCKFISLGLIFLQDTAGSTAFVKEYPEYLPYLDLSIILFLDLNRGGEIPNIQVCFPKVAVKWQSWPHQHRKIPNFWDWAAKCMCCKEINKIFYDAFQLYKMTIHCTVYIHIYVMYSTNMIISCTAYNCILNFLQSRKCIASCTIHCGESNIHHCT